MRRAAKIDENHHEIVKAFRHLGWSVLDIHQIPNSADIIMVQAAKASIKQMTGEDGGDYETFTIVEKNSGIEIELPSLKSEALESVESMLNDQYEKINARLREI